MEIKDKRVEKLSEHFENEYVRGFLEEVKGCLTEHPDLAAQFEQEWEDTRRYYESMVDSFAKGIPDAERKKIFVQIENYMYKTMVNLQMYDHVQNHSALKAAQIRAKKIDLLYVGDLLKSHVGDMDFYRDVFSAILVSYQWGIPEDEKIISLLIAEDTDVVFAQLMVSAITLSCLCSFDIWKMCALMDIYEEAKDLKVKERALVGWTFCSCLAPDFMESRVAQLLEGLLESEDVMNEVLELQKQVFYCLDADKDSRIVQNSVISTIKNDSYHKFFKSDLEDSSLSEIIHPEIEEEKTEKLENTMKKMMDMEMAGSDVYFGGFSKMKNFAFFHSLSNWFMPYFPGHPSLKNKMNLTESGEKFLAGMAKNSTFCDSDKYSFAFALQTIVKTELSTVQKIFDIDLWSTKGMTQLMEGVDEAALVRRSYLQDLFRFFRLSPFASAFVNPFTDKPDSCGYFFLNWHFEDGPSPILQPLLKLCRFLVKRKDYKRLGAFAPLVGNENLDEGTLLYALYLMNYRNAYHEAAMLLTLLNISQDNDENVTVLKATAKCYMEMGLYKEAVSELKKLQNVKPSTSNLLKMAYCKLKGGKVDEAMEMLYKLNFEEPDNMDVVRSLAWGNILRGDYEKAMALYDRLTENAQANPGLLFAEDTYNKGLCLWLKGDMDAACYTFKQYVQIDQKDKEPLFDKIKSDLDLLVDHGIEEYETFLMRDAVESFRQ